MLSSIRSKSTSTLNFQDGLRPKRKRGPYRFHWKHSLQLGRRANSINLQFGWSNSELQDGLRL